MSNCTLQEKLPRCLLYLVRESYMIEIINISFTYPYLSSTYFISKGNFWSNTSFCRYKTDNYTTAFYTNEFILSTVIQNVTILNRKKFLIFSLKELYELSKIQPDVYEILFNYTIPTKTNSVVKTFTF